MKFLPELGPCFGGATTSNDSTVTLRGKDDVGRPYNGDKSHRIPSGGSRKVKSTNSSRQWKPSLRVISEDTMMVSVSDKNESSDKSKVKEKSRAKPKSPYNGEEYWKSSSLWALPAFAPTLSPF